MTLTVIVLLSFSVFSCARYRHSSGDKIVFDTINVQQVFKSAPEQPPVTYRLDVDFVYPSSMSDTAKLARLQAAFTEKFFDDFSGLSPRKAVDSLLAQQKSYFQTILSPGDFEDEEPTDFASEYHLIMKNEVVFQGAGLVSFVVESEDYWGGAHPLHSIAGYVFNLATGEFLTEDNFAGAHYGQNIGKLISASIAAMYSLNAGETLEDIGFDSNQIAPNGNFTVDAEGITYYYNEYEIACYAVGQSRAFIPYSELSVYIRPDSPLARLIKK
jgi:hypothetical protein